MYGLNNHIPDNIEEVISSLFVLRCLDVPRYMDFRIPVKFCLKVSLLGNYNKNVKFIIIRLKNLQGVQCFYNVDRSGSVRVLSIEKQGSGHSSASQATQL